MAILFARRPSWRRTESDGYLAMSDFTDSIQNAGGLLLLEPRSEFVAAHTAYGSISELLVAAGVDENNEAELIGFARAGADDFIRQASSFGSWQEFLHAALADAEEYARH